MDDLRLHAVVARVVAWHNRHPLARRITAAQVNSVGYVALPCTAPGLPPPAPPAPPASPPDVSHTPATVPAERVEGDPVIETADSGGIVIDVDPEPQAPGEGDSPSTTIGADLQAAAPDQAPAADTARDPATQPATGPTLDDSPGAAGPPATDTLAPAAKPASSLRARAAAREDGASTLPGGAPKAATPAAMPAPGVPRTLVCSEDFMAPIPVRQVLDWVRIHGLALPREPGDGPVHQVPVDVALLPEGAGVGQLWVATAAIEVAGRRHRLLLGGGTEPAVLGRRLRSAPRWLGALVVPVVLVATVTWWMWPKSHAAVVPAAGKVVAAGAAASAAAGGAGPASAASASGHGPAHEPAHASLAEASASASVVAVQTEAHSPAAESPRLPGLLDDAAKAQARAAVAALRAERQAHAPVKPAAAAATELPASPRSDSAAPVAQPAPPPAALFGLSTRLLRTRAEAEQLQSAFQALLGGAPRSALRVEMLPVGEDWRVVCWPYERRADAERARTLLMARGLRVELVDF